MSRAYPARGLGTSSATGGTFSMTALIRQRTKTASITLRTARQPRHCNNMHTRRGTKLATTFMYFCHFVNDKFKKYSACSIRLLALHNIVPSSSNTALHWNKFII